jgi:hypothetical protein
MADKPTIHFIPASTNEDRIRFFGTLMPALLLLKQSPLQFLRFQILTRLTPRADVADFIQSETDDVGQAGDVWLFIHRWHTDTFDAITFGLAKTFQATRPKHSTRSRRALTCPSWLPRPAWGISARTSCWCTRRLGHA